MTPAEDDKSASPPCPVCKGILVEVAPAGPGATIRTEHICGGPCGGIGLVTRASAQKWWAARPPTA